MLKGEPSGLWTRTRACARGEVGCRGNHTELLSEWAIEFIEWLDLDCRHCFSTANFIVDFRTLALSDPSRANTTARVAVTEPSFPSTMVSICTTSEPSFSHRIALWESNSATCWRSMPRLAFCGTSAGNGGSSISRKAEPSRTKTETELPRFQSIAVTANALESGLHSTPSI